MSHLFWPILAGIVVAGIISSLLRHQEKAKLRARRPRPVHPPQGAVRPATPTYFVGGFGNGPDCLYADRELEVPSDAFTDLP